MTTPRDFSIVPYYEGFALEAEDDIYDTDTVYLFTWSPDPARYPTNDPKEQYKILFDLVLRNAKKVFTTFSFTPECNAMGNVHIHGWYVIKDKVKYFKWWLPKCKQFGFVKINVMKTKDALGYYKKDMNYMQEVCDPHPVPFTHLTSIGPGTATLSKKRVKTIVVSKKYVDVTRYFKKK